MKKADKNSYLKKSKKAHLQMRKQLEVIKNIIEKENLKTEMETKRLQKLTLRWSKVKKDLKEKRNEKENGKKKKKF